MKTALAVIATALVCVLPAASAEGDYYTEGPRSCATVDMVSRTVSIMDMNGAVTLTTFVRYPNFLHFGVTVPRYVRRLVNSDGTALRQGCDRS